MGITMLSDVSTHCKILVMIEIFIMDVVHITDIRKILTGFWYMYRKMAGEKKEINRICIS